MKWRSIVVATIGLLAVGCDLCLLVFGGWYNPLVVLHLCFAVLVALFFIKNRFDFANPLHAFLSLTFVSFWAAYLYYTFYPSELYIYNDSIYNLAFNCDGADFDKAFVIFVVGIGCFVLGFSIKQRRIPVRLRFVQASPMVLVIAATLVVAAFSLFRIYFKVNLPGFTETAFRGVGFIYNPGVYAVNILVVYAAFVGIRSGSRLLIGLGLVPCVVNALALGFVGIKSGLIYSLAMLYVCYEMQVKAQVLQDPRVLQLLRTGALLLALLSLLIFNLTGYQRLLLMVSGYDYTSLRWDDFVEGFKAYRSDDNVVYGDASVMAPLRRLTGINSFAPIVAYGDWKSSGEVSLMQNLRDASINTFTPFAGSIKTENIYPETYLTYHVLGVSKDITTTNAPGVFGSLYLYDGIAGVTVGMFIIGALLRLVYNTATASLTYSPLMYIIYPVFFVLIVLQVLMEGTIVNFLCTALPAFLIAVVLVYCLNSVLLGAQGLIRRAARSGGLPQLSVERTGEY